MKQVSKQTAIEIFNNTDWQKIPDKEAVFFQLHQSKLCVPDLWKKVDQCLGRNTLNIEIREWPKLLPEFVQKNGNLNLEEIFEKIKAAQQESPLHDS